MHEAASPSVAASLHRKLQQELQNAFATQRNSSSGLEKAFAEKAAAEQNLGPLLQKWEEDKEGYLKWVQKTDAARVARRKQDKLNALTAGVEPLPDEVEEGAKAALPLKTPAPSKKPGSARSKAGNINSGRPRRTSIEDAEEPNPTFEKTRRTSIEDAEEPNPTCFYENAETILTVEPKVVQEARWMITDAGRRIVECRAAIDSASTVVPQLKIRVAACAVLAALPPRRAFKTAAIAKERELATLVRSTEMAELETQATLVSARKAAKDKEAVAAEKKQILDEALAKTRAAHSEGLMKTLKKSVTRVQRRRTFEGEKAAAKDEKLPGATPATSQPSLALNSEMMEGQKLDKHVEVEENASPEGEADKVDPKSTYGLLMASLETAEAKHAMAVTEAKLLATKCTEAERAATDAFTAAEEAKVTQVCLKLLCKMLPKTSIEATREAADAEVSTTSP